MLKQKKMENARKNKYIIKSKEDMTQKHKERKPKSVV